MVSPIYLIAITLFTAFLLPIFEKASRNLAQIIVILVTAGLAALPGSYIISWISQSGVAGLLSVPPVLVETAGFSAPFSIALQLGSREAILLVLMNTVALLSIIYQLNTRKAHWHGKELILFLMLLVGTNGLVMTRDLFNIFVFLEITSIATYSLIASRQRPGTFEAGFKYMIAGAISSAFFLIGVIYLYRLTGTLSLDHMLQTGMSVPAVETALLFLMIALLIELKPLPANGWAIDTYEAADVTVSALISAVAASGVLFVFYKITPLFTPRLLSIAAVSGLVTFLGSNLIGLKQHRVQRMLGYSSVAQIGLLVFVISFGYASFSDSQVTVIVLLLLGTHALSKAGLFWLAPLFKEIGRYKPRARGILIFSISTLILALSGLPPFPAFWGKWYLFQELAGGGEYLFIALILAGSLLETGYLFRWFARETRDIGDPGTIHAEIIPGDLQQDGYQTGTITSKRALQEMSAQKSPLSPSDSPEGLESSGTISNPLSPAKTTAALISALLLSTLGVYAASHELPLLLLVPLAAVAAGFLLDLLKVSIRIQLIISLAAVGMYSAYVLPSLSGIASIFGWMFLVGAAVQMVVLFQRSGTHMGMAGLFTGLIFSLGNLLVIESKLSLFYSWELMSIFSYLLIFRGRTSSGAALRYLIFSIAGAYSILMGLMLLPGTGLFPVGATVPAGAGILLATGFLIKIGAAGFHIWLPGAYAEADNDISPLLSSVLSKAGLYMLFIFASTFFAVWRGASLLELLGWIGVITALVGAFLALFQEDIKYTLAYSSMGQMGYMLLAFALMTQLGWITSLYLAVTHLLFKSMLFIAIAGVLYRTKTRMMYQCGGLISRMPISFITVLVAIIALSGVPPLTGFGAKWLLYTALIEKGWYLQAGGAMFASGIAFLYLFRLIHSIFLGQLKDDHRSVKEAPIWFLIPQIIAIGIIILFSMFPDLIIKPLEVAVGSRFAQDIHWEGYTVISTLGYWNGNAVMYVTMGVFIVPLLWLLLVQRRHTRKVGQFNIVFASERPYRPETTHYAYNFYAPYRSALGMFLRPWTTSFWAGIQRSLDILGSIIRRIYTGNAQTYALHILIYAAVVLLVTQGGI